MLSYLGCNLFQALPSHSGNLAETRHLLSLEPGDDVDVQVEYVLASGSAVLLDYAYAVGAGGFFCSSGYSLGDLVNLSQQFFRRVEDVFVMLFRDDKRVPFTCGSDIHEGEDLGSAYTTVAGASFREILQKMQCSLNVLTLRRYASCL